MRVSSACADANCRTLQNQRQSPLLRLPGELRNQIYHYALEGIHIVVEEDIESYVTRGGRLYWTRAWQGRSDKLRQPKAFLGLTQACHQVHSEIGLLPFELLTVQFYFEREHGTFLNMLSEAQRTAITTVKVDEADALSLKRRYKTFCTLTQRKLGSRDVKQIAHRVLRDLPRHYNLNQLPQLKRVVVDNRDGVLDEEDDVIPALRQNCHTVQDSDERNEEDLVAGRSRHYVRSSGAM